MKGTVKVEWNSKAIIDLIKEMAAEQETEAAKRIFAHAIKDAPFGKVVRFKTAKSKKWKWYYKRTPGTLMRSIKNVASKFAHRGGGRIVLAGDDRLVYYAHFVEFGTVFSKKRGGSRFLRKALLRERRQFKDSIAAALEGDMR
jgi:hypothetical protein